MRGSGILVRCVLLIDFCSLLVRRAIVRKIANLEAQEGASGGLIQQHASSLTYARHYPHSSVPVVVEYRNIPFEVHR